MLDRLTKIPGYDFGTTRVAHSPLGLDELRALEASVGWTDADAAVLRKAAPILIPQAEAMVDAWRAEIARQPELIRWFCRPDGKPDDKYRARVKRRFVQWVIDALTRPHDQAWLDYQEEIGLRHTPAKKNLTDGTQTPDRVPLRYLVSFVAAVAQSVRGFLGGQGLADDEMDAMCQAWLKAVLLHITLWCRPYVKDGLW